jgi:hypothetical protein
LPEPREKYQCLAQASHSYNIWQEDSNFYPLMRVRLSQSPSHAVAFLECCSHSKGLKLL